MTELTPLERTIRRLAGDSVDRVPNQNIFMAFAAHYIGTTYSQFAQDYRLLVEANLRASEAFHLDWVSVISDPVREAAAFGAQIRFPEDSVPFCEPLITDYAQVDGLPDWDPWMNERTADRLRGVQLYRQRVGGYYPICGWVDGAAAVAAMLRGVNHFLEDTILEPENLTRLLQRCSSGAIRFALAQLEAGADMIGLGDAVTSLLSPQAYRTFALPYEQALISEVYRAGGLVKLHICGNTTRLLPLIAETGADIIDVDWMVSLPDAVKICGEHASVNGNIDPVALFLQGTPTSVTDAAKNCLLAANNRTLISAGCEIPSGTPHVNILAHYEALRRG
ncbi:MAG: uroporphyrinogen decarboxylase family protein [Anaerolineae bacterium]